VKEYSETLDDAAWGAASDVAPKFISPSDPARFGGRSTSSAAAMFISDEAAHIDTFRSPGLLARLDDPTEWSKKLQPVLTDFLRGPCQTLISLGGGVGGAVFAAIRIASEIKDKAGAAQRLMSAVPAIAQLPGVTAAHVGQYVVTDISGTAEAKLRANVPDNISFVVLVEGVGVPELESATPQLVDIASAASSATCEAGVYRLAYMLDAP